MLSVGETLKRARLEQGLDLSTVAAQTRINPKYLEAIESDDRKKLPSGFFYRSFVDQYAKSLSLDTRDINAEIDRVLSADAPLPLPGGESVVSRNVPPIRYRNRFSLRRGLTSMASLVLVVAGCSAVYAWWHDPRASLSAAAMLANARDFAKHKMAVVSVQAQSPSPEKNRTPETRISKPEQNAAPVPLAPVALASSSQTPEPVNSSAAPEAASGKVLLDLMAREETWLSVSSDGKPVFSGTLLPNQTKTVEGKQFAKLRVGNAAGIEVRLNGKLLGPLGARGQVLTLVFTPDNFQVVPSANESD